MKFTDFLFRVQELWAQFQSFYQSGDYASALAMLQNTQLTNKALTADILNALTDYIVQVEQLNDSTFKTDKILCQVNQPTQSTGQVWFEVSN